MYKPDFGRSGSGQDFEDSSRWSWDQRLEREVDSEGDTERRYSVEASRGVRVEVRMLLAV
jgi:hypothetical protein